MSSDCPVVSIAIPIFNGGKHLLSTLECIENQNYPRIEVFLLNNGSTDNTADIISEFMSKKLCKTYTLIQCKSPSGMVNDWNNAMSYATGKYFKLLPADDILSSSAISKQVEALEIDPSLSFVVSRKWIINSNNQICRHPVALREGRLSGSRAYSRLIASPINLLGEPGSGLITTTTLKKVGNYNNRLTYYPDLDYWLRLLKQGDGYYLDGQDYFFRIHLGSATLRSKHHAPYDFLEMCKANGKFNGSKFSSFGLGYLFLKARIISEIRHAFIKLKN